MKLPQISYDVGKGQSEIVAMRGINYSDQIQDGDLRDSLNMSARRYPYITTRRARERQNGYTSATALTAWGKLVAVDGTNLLYDGEIVAHLINDETVNETILGEYMLGIKKQTAEEIGGTVFA